MRVERMSEEQRKGARFEIWLEQLLRESGVEQLYRNAIYLRDARTRRQVDIAYIQPPQLVRTAQGLQLSRSSGKLMAIEAKYVSNGSRPASIRSPVEKIGHPHKIDNIVDEHLERSRFVGAYHAFLITNHEFDARTHELVEDYSPQRPAISLIERDGLEQKRHELGRRGSLEQELAAIDLASYNHHPTRIYLP